VADEWPMAEIFAPPCNVTQHDIYTVVHKDVTIYVRP